MIDGVAYTPTSISGGYLQNYNEYVITATYSSATLTQEVQIYLTNYAMGTYPLDGNSSSYGGGTYFTGPNASTLTVYVTTGNAPYTGTCIITSSINSVVSGTFNFTATNGTNSPVTHSITNGSFANIAL